MAIKTIAQFRTEATSEIESAKPMYAQVNNERREFTDSEYTQAIEDLAQSKLDTQDNGYKSARQEAYNSIQDQLDMQYWDSVNSTTTWADHIAQVKSDNPKPS
jgi:phosphoribosylformylglycinamidine (FGAM) synthase-like enzyme